MTPTVLVVDDEPDVRLMLRLKLRREQFDVIEATGGVHALEILAQTTPDVIILDLRMPDVDGWAVLRALGEIGRLAHLKVITFSAHATNNAVEQALALGSRAHVSKSRSLDQIVGTIRAVLAA
jgi:two-component system KDP operon response regulator KdpE